MMIAKEKTPQTRHWTSSAGAPFGWLVPRFAKVRLPKADRDYLAEALRPRKWGLWDIPLEAIDESHLQRLIDAM
jgi:hypothetical protein